MDGDGGRQRYTSERAEQSGHEVAERGQRDSHDTETVSKHTHTHTRACVTQKSKPQLLLSSCVSAVMFRW